MNNLLKYILLTIILFLLVIFYFFNTNMGHENLKNFLESSLSKKTDNKIEVTSLNLDHYPNLLIKVKINNTLNMTLRGELDNEEMSMSYHLTGERFKLDTMLINDKVDIRGTLVGSFDSLEVTGSGKAFDGKVEYTFTNLPNVIENMNLEMKEVNSSKILKFLEQKEFVQGGVDINADFTKFSKYEKDGEATIHMVKAQTPLLQQKLPFELNAKINFANIKNKFNATLTSKLGKITIENGIYDSSKQIFDSLYNINITNLAYLKKLLRHQYKGSLNTKGSIHYNKDNEQLQIKGVTSKLGGELTYIYRNRDIDLKFKNLSLKKLLDQLDTPILFNSKINGTINYSAKEDLVVINTQLKKTRFVPSKLTQTIQNKLKTNLLKGSYEQSYFSGGFKGDVLSGILTLDNGRNYIKLTKTKLNIQNNRLSSNFKIKMQGTKVEGKIYGTLEKPQVKIETKFFTLPNKQMDSWLKENYLH